MGSRRVLFIWHETLFPPRNGLKAGSEYNVIMGKFREHTLEEIRRLRNARQKRKRQQRAAERLALERAKITKEREHERRTASKLRETARKFCRKWREKCQENNKMRNLLLQYRPQVRILKRVLAHTFYGTKYIWS